MNEKKMYHSPKEVKGIAFLVVNFHNAARVLVTEWGPMTYVNWLKKEKARRVMASGGVPHFIVLKDRTVGLYMKGVREAYEYPE